MTTQEFETEIAVKIALLEPKEIAGLRGLAKMASVASTQTLNGVETSWADHLRRGLAHFVHEVLKLEGACESPGRPPVISIGPSVRAADASAVTRCLLGISASSVPTAPARMTLADYQQLELLLRRLSELVDSVHAPRELGDFGWQWSDFNAGWENAAGNAEYELSTVWRALRSHDEGWLPPKDPAGSGHMPDFITYWFSLAAVVLGHLAWSNPSVGMARWVNAGMPGDEGVLSGLKRLYGPDAAALILNWNVPELANTVKSRLPNSRSRGAMAYDPSPILMQSPSIIEPVRGRRNWSAMLCGGSDSLHLREHLKRLLLSPSPRPIRLAGGHDAVSSPHAHLLLPDAYGWHESLQRTGDGLPNRTDGRSWRVDITSATLGYLGEFRKSRETGRWFAGKHSSHMLGN